jgi:recombination protein RecR
MGPLHALINALKRLPGVGEKTATRYAFYIINADDDEVHRLVSAIGDVKAKLRLCSFCFNLTDIDPCKICADPRRDATRICVVETPLDLMAVEKGAVFKGVYHVLQGLLSPLDAIGPNEIRVRELVARATKDDIKEVVLALNPTVEGESTAAYIRDQLSDAAARISRIAYGVPMGGALEFTDPLTLARAMENRREL